MGKVYMAMAALAASSIVAAPAFAGSYASATSSTGSISTSVAYGNASSITGGIGGNYSAAGAGKNGVQTVSVGGSLAGTQSQTGWHGFGGAGTTVVQGGSASAGAYQHK